MADAEVQDVDQFETHLGDGVGAHFTFGLPPFPGEVIQGFGRFGPHGTVKRVARVEPVRVDLGVQIALVLHNSQALLDSDFIHVLPFAPERVAAIAGCSENPRSDRG
ncbi:hypothetical protein D3C86_1893560 [compost metagenome]